MKKSKKLVNRSVLVAVKLERISEFQNLSFVRNIETQETFFRYRYYISNSKAGHVPVIKDYPRKDFKNFREFVKFIRELTPENRQVFSWGIYDEKNPRNTT